MLQIRIDVHQKSSVLNVFISPAEGDGGTHRWQKVETTATALQAHWAASDAHLDKRLSRDLDALFSDAGRQQRWPKLDKRRPIQ